MQKRNVWVQCLSWWLTFCLNALVSWAVSNTAVHFAIPLELIALPSLMSMLQIPREAGPCEKLPGSVPMHQDRRTPHPDTSAVGKLSSSAAFGDKHETCPRFPRQLKPQDILFEFGQPSLECGFQQKEERKGGVKGSVSGAGGLSSHITSLPRGSHITSVTSLPRGDAPF